MSLSSRRKKLLRRVFAHAIYLSATFSHSFTHEFFVACDFFSPSSFFFVCFLHFSSLRCSAGGVLFFFIFYRIFCPSLRCSAGGAFFFFVFYLIFCSSRRCSAGGALSYSILLYLLFCLSSVLFYLILLSVFCPVVWHLSFVFLWYAFLILFSFLCFWSFEYCALPLFSFSLSFALFFMTRHPVCCHRLLPRRHYAKVCIEFYLKFIALPAHYFTVHQRPVWGYRTLNCCIRPPPMLPC